MRRTRFYLALILPLLAVFYSGLASAEDYYWERYTAPDGKRYSSAVAACESHYPKTDHYDTYTYAGIKWTNASAVQCQGRRSNGNVFGQFSVVRRGDSCPPDTTYNNQTGECEAPEPQCPGDSTRQPDGSCALECDAPDVPNHVTMTCEPPPLCPEGQYWDFETESCKWPEDDQCPTGSNWSPSLKDCVCDGDGVLSNAQGFRICMPPADDECTPDSPDFKGYYNGYTPFCSGESRCPPGTTYGAVGKGDYIEHVCIPNQPPEDPDCPGGTLGNMGGETICVPPYNQEDPDCPTGFSGTVNGEKVCQPDPDAPPEDSDCKPGETPGYVGRGDEMKKVCVPEGYKPETCKAGTYPINNGSGGFACVPVSGGAGPGGTDNGSNPKPGTGDGGKGDGDGSTGGGGGGKDGEEAEPTPSTVGGESCATELRCEGDAIQCAILRKQKDQVCQWKFDGEVQAQVEAIVSGPGYQLDEKQVGVGSLFNEALGQGRWLPSTCPAPRSITIMGRSYSFEWEPLCHFAQSIGPLIVALASIFFAVFIGRGIKGG
ncbi:virulence factor TspB C-terminal domain-related protein [Ectopseudomonas khazarica]|uniref:virulence factor TspB C-terminal domain-related protein n=1 Tax=Ectopseudomonas khazarica TaxID=2502979 RepID=UPI0037C93BAD